MWKSCNTDNAPAKTLVQEPGRSHRLPPTGRRQSEEMCPPVAVAMDMWKAHMRNPSRDIAAPSGHGKEIKSNTGLPTAPMLDMAREQRASPICS